MEDYTCKENYARLPLSALRLLVPPIQLVSAAVWQTTKQRVVADYGMLEEFVSMVTEIVPGLLSSLQRAKLVLGLRARLILELCQLEGTADFDTVQPHLDRMQILIEAWTGAAGTGEQPNSNFVVFVKHLLNSPVEREHFFQKVFPEEFGTSYDEELQSLMWLFLSKLEYFLPPLTFHQVASMFGELSSVLEDSIESVSQLEDLKALLQYPSDPRPPDLNDGSLKDTCIFSALKLDAVEITRTEEPLLEAQCLHDVLACTSEMEKESSPSPYTTETTDGTLEGQSNMEIDNTKWFAGENETVENLGEISKQEEYVGLLESENNDDSCLLKECCIQLERLDMPVSSQSRPVRLNRGLRMKMILLEEKSGLHTEDLHTSRSVSSKIQAPNMSSPEISDNEDSSDVSKASSWSFYSDEDSFQKGAVSSSDSWSIYSSDDCSTPDNSLSSFSNDYPSFASTYEDKGSSATSTNHGSLDNKSKAPKRTRRVQCFICHEQVKTTLRTHMKTHFPNGDYACPQCDSRFKLLTSLQLHLKKICFEHVQQRADPDKVQNLYKCGKCEEAFKYKLSLEAHQRIHNELYCSVCRKVLRDTATLERHKASHTLFQCTRCEETFTVFKPLLKHCENVHKISKPFRCNHCPKTFSRLRILIGHEWKHTGHLPFQCAQCSLRFKTDTDLVSHQRVHTRDRPYLCANCGKTFSQKSNLLRHLNFIHSEFRNEKKFFCSECEKSFKEKGSLIKHQRIKHYNEFFRHPCPYCGKMFSASSINRHKLIHTGERPFKCTVPECEKYFRSTSEVKRHVLTSHTTERPYKCDVCGKGFIKMYILKTHSKIHSGEKPFVCQICGKAFPKLYSMRRHKRLVHMFAIS